MTKTCHYCITSFFESNDKFKIIIEEHKQLRWRQKSIRNIRTKKEINKKLINIKKYFVNEGIFHYILENY